MCVQSRWWSRLGSLVVRLAEGLAFWSCPIIRRLAVSHSNTVNITPS